MYHEAAERICGQQDDPSTPRNQKLCGSANPPGAPRRQPSLATWVSRPREDSLDLRQYFLGLPIGEPPVPGPLKSSLSRLYEDKQTKRLRCRTKLEPSLGYSVPESSRPKATVTEHLQRLAEACDNNQQGEVASTVSPHLAPTCPLETHKRQRLDSPINLHAQLDSPSFHNHLKPPDTQLDSLMFSTYTPKTPSSPLTSAGYHFDDSSSSSPPPAISAPSNSS